ncbi:MULTISPECIES: PTS sugar transporter subunit IIC [Bacillaceae]|uniref:Phosphotransferase system EIIC domain-containing protein n=1 Tax=Gottfriedia luciferensis TaxID=178774 RepID=A0ABX2ZQS9_9BACI|nr:MULTISPECIES: PTS sugar transporter subunit IIC [Bacillaceae]ODG91762.1 hypothetical protein BED47_21795 [Gottfriedia luciferensis]SFD46447.1 hypothetical protein SAMN02799633_03917 [Bacillus sp. UNCCL81]
MSTQQKSRVFRASEGIAHAVFVMIGIGSLLESIGKIFHFESLMTIGFSTKLLMAPAIGAGIAVLLGSSTLIIFSAMAAAIIGSGALLMVDTAMTIKMGEPVGALLSALVAILIGKAVQGKTKLDLMVVPLFAILISGLVGLYLSKWISPILIAVGNFIKGSTEGSPIIASIVLAVVWGILIVSPASSAALAIALNLDGLAGGAALAGCAAQFVGLAVISARENDPGSILGLLIITPKLQLPNVTRNIRILIPTIVASAVAGPISAFLFHIEAPKEIAGLGLCALVAPMNLLATYGSAVMIPMIVTYILVPGIVSYIVYIFLKQANMIKTGELKIL